MRKILSVILLVCCATVPSYALQGRGFTQGEMAVIQPFVPVFQCYEQVYNSYMARFPSMPYFAGPKTDVASYKDARKITAKEKRKIVSFLEDIMDCPELPGPFEEGSKQGKLRATFSKVVVSDLDQLSEYMDGKIPIGVYRLDSRKRELYWEVALYDILRTNKHRNPARTTLFDINVALTLARNARTQCNGLWLRRRFEDMDKKQIQARERGLKKCREGYREAELKAWSK